MALIPFRPFGDLESFFDESEWFPLVPSLKIKEPKMDIYEKEDRVVAEVEIPGIDPKKVNVSVKDNVLKVEGGEEKKEEEKKKGYYRQEIRKGYFRRTAALPVKVSEDKIEASYEDGVLKIVMPKAKPAKGRKEKKVQIKVKK